MKKTLIAKIVFAVVVLIVIALLSTFVQHVLFGENNIAFTAAVSFASAYMMWRLLWKPTK